VLIVDHAAPFLLSLIFPLTPNLFQFLSANGA